MNNLKHVLFLLSNINIHNIAVYRKTYICDKLIFLTFWLTFKIFKYSVKSVKQMLYYTCNHNYINKIIVKQYIYNINLNVYIQNKSQCSFLNKYTIV